MKKILTLLCLIFILAACSTAPTDAPADVVDDDMEEMDETEEDTEDTMDDAMDTASTAGPEDATDDLRAFIDSMRSVAYMVTYDMQSSVEGATGTLMQWYKDPETIRIDTAGEYGESRVYILGGTTTVCTTASGSMMCFESQPGQEVQGEVVGQDSEELESGSVSALPDRMVLGISTKCFRSTVEQGHVDYCFSPQGVPLYMDNVAEGYRTTMEATAYTLSVSDSDFEVPAGVDTMNIEDMMANIPQ